MLDETLSQQLIQRAESAYQNSYAPYSKFRVGSAILLEDGSVYSGCNIENISYGLSSCAERNAIFRAVCQRGKIAIKALALANHKHINSAPCGACRQVIYEFSNHETVIIYPEDNSYAKSYLKNLLPATFSEF